MAPVGVSCSSGASGDKKIPLQKPYLSSALHSHFPGINYSKQTQSLFLPWLLIMLNTDFKVICGIHAFHCQSLYTVDILMNLHIYPGTDFPQNTFGVDAHFNSI